MKQLMKQMNMREVDAEEVIIKTSTKQLRIRNPKVTSMDVAGQTTYQVTGEVEELIEEKDEDGGKENDEHREVTVSKDYSQIGIIELSKGREYIEAFL